MDVKAQLCCINHFLSDMYNEDTRISGLLSDGLDEEKLHRIKQPGNLHDFIKLFIFGIRCSFACSQESIENYKLLSLHYGLEDAQPHPLSEIHTLQNISAEQAQRLMQRAMAMLRPTSDKDLLKNMARMAAENVLSEADRSLVKWQSSSNDIQTLRIMDAAALAEMHITNSGISLTKVTSNVNAAFGLSKGHYGYIEIKMIRNWLVENGYLEYKKEELRGLSTYHPTSLGKKIGMDIAEMDKGPVKVKFTVYNNQAQLFIRDNLHKIIQS